jgi:tetratricopeptide (TPR) repeat protein
VLSSVQKITLLSFFMSSFLGAQWKFEPRIDSLVRKGIDLIMKQEYDAADQLFGKTAAIYPQHPVGYLYQAAVMQAIAIDFDVPIDQNRFDSLLTLGRKYAESFSCPWRECFSGTADGYEAYERVERGNWVGGITTGIKSVNRFEEILEKDSSFYDAYVGIGTYDYWSSRKTSFIRWLPLVSDNRQKGITLLKLAAERAEYNRFAAISALVSIFIDAEKYEDVLEWSRIGLKSYPQNRLFLWGIATAYDRVKNYSAAIQAYDTLFRNILSANAPHPYGEIVSRLNLVKSKLAIHDSSGVKEHLETILSYQHNSFPSHLQSRVKDKFAQASKLLADLKKN